MKLHHWVPPRAGGEAVTNFGDELNTVLWQRLLGPSFFDDDDAVAFLGIGSLLGWPKDGDATRRHRVVFGTGAAFADAATREPRQANWRIYCVRGPLTARAYELDAAAAVTDPAILLARFHCRVDPDVRVGFMPHLDTATGWSHLLEPACAEIGVRFIDPRADVGRVVGAVASVSLLVAEAMHGAITADALRVPWIPVYTTARPHRFKWTDWCRSMGLDYRPRRLVNAALWGARLGFDGAPTARAAARMFQHRLRRLVGTGAPTLSDLAVHRRRIDQLETALDRLRADVRAGFDRVP